MTEITTPIRIAVIGSGPAGFYAAGHLLKDSPGDLVEVDMFERLPTPWGLVRSGVAPDHPNIKSVTRVYEKTAEYPRFRYFGNVELGRDVTREELMVHYHSIVYATGAPTDRPLGIPGEGLAGSLPSAEFVGWYNGHPGHRDLRFDLQVQRAVVIGNGNVALDVARMLVLSPTDLGVTDTADHALEALANSAIREVVVLGRRGPLQAAFTNPELRELGKLVDADVLVDPTEIDRAILANGNGASADRAGGDRAGGDGADGDGVGGDGADGDGVQADVSATAAANLQILREYASRPPREAQRRIVLRFLCSPVELIDDGAGRVQGVRVVHNDLVEAPDGSLRARANPASEEVIDAGLVLRAVGYRGMPLEGVPFDAHTGVILNEEGRVVEDGGTVRRGEYVSGWIKRGPTGVIGTNKKDARETVDAILTDLAAGKLHLPADPDASSVQALLEARKPNLVTYEGWTRIDRHERDRGEPVGRPRVKLTTIEEMLRVAADS